MIIKIIDIDNPKYKNNTDEIDNENTNKNVNKNTDTKKSEVSLFYNRKNKKYNKSEDEDYEEIMISKGNKRKKRYVKKKNLEEKSLSDNEIKDYIENTNDNKKPIISNTNKNKIKTKFLYSSETKNYIYFYCYKRKYGCKGTAKINKKEKKLVITYYCENNVEHIELDYEEFADLIDKKDLNNIDFNNKINQRYYVFHILKQNNDQDLNTIYKKFYEETKIKLSLSKSCICKIRSKINDNYKGLSLLELINKIKIDIPDLFSNIIDIKYDIKITLIYAC